MDPMHTNSFSIQLYNHTGRIRVSYDTAKITTVAKDEDSHLIITLEDDKDNTHNKITLKVKDHGEKGRKV